ncbi:hypothetical protein SK128_018491 [Halocaridina rubra]|uniref:Cupin-like domain-containing protein n=1 Tax=Halocaridina rubra TaxID=373956 RepID=A0AAN8XI44_HALRR
MSLGMAENNNVYHDSSVHNLTKLRLLCDRFVQEATEKGTAVEEIVDKYVEKHSEILTCVKRHDTREMRSRVNSANHESAKKCPCFARWAMVLAPLLVLIVAVCISDNTISDFISSKCLVRNNYFVMEVTRPPTNCQRVCGGVKAPVLLSANVTQREFAKWAYLSRPLIVRKGAAHWPALERFSLSFFRSVYDSVEGSYEAVSEECQFLPFKSEFVDLREALRMHPARAARLPGTTPWYFGWSNCSPGVSAVLRELAPRPSFLPEHSESSALDWIFMGGDGPGASWHLDYVQRPSWQAQVSGTKTWHFRPVPECQHTCQSFSATVKKGDIIFVDTNQWYHTTHIHKGQLSITIGSEYD